MGLFNTNHGVIVSCEVKTIEELKKLVAATCSVEGVVGYKHGFMLGLGFGLKTVVDVMRDITDLPVIYDHQKAGTDIPAMGMEFAAAMKRAGVDSAIIFPQAGPKTQEAFVKALLQQGVVPMVGGDMTHDGYLESEGGYIAAGAPEKMYENGAKAGTEFFIVPGTKPAAIRKYAALLGGLTKPKFCMPGIGRQGGDIRTAFESCQGNPAYAIIGTAIHSAADMTTAAKKFCSEAMKFE